MHKTVLMILLAVMSSSAMAGNWTYGEIKDEMRGTVSTYSKNESVNTVNFGFPYAGVQHGTIMILDKGVLFHIKKGQIVCTGGGEIGTCSVLVKFDDGVATYAYARKLGDESTDIIFTAHRFLSNLVKSKKLKIQVEVYHNGSPVFDFDLRGLKHTQVSINSTASEEFNSTVKVAGAKSYVVQIGSYGLAEAADKELGKLEAWNFNAYTEKSGDKIRLRVGPYAEREKAEEVQRQLEKHGMYPVVLSIE